MKILLTSDVHIYNYQSYNASFDGDKPSRLLGFKLLGDRIKEIATKEKCERIIIAGDLNHAAVLRPMVHNVAQEFLKLISETVPTMITHGQHDLDEKTSEFSRDNSAIEVSSHLENCYYYHDEVVAVDGVSIYFLGWEPSIRSSDKMPDSDIFVGHHVVGGSKNAFGHVFSTGYDAEKLSSKYKFSVVGDIHCGQILYGNVLLPGPPIQHSFGDPELCGVHILDTSDWSCKFVEISGVEWPKFRTVDSEEDIVPEENVYYKVRQSVIGSKKSSLSSVKDTDLRGLTTSVIDGLKLADQEELKELANKYIDEASNIPAETLPKAIVTGISLRCFGSVEKLDLSFKERSKILILGSVGSGKSTILKGLSWTLYGKTIPSISNDQLRPITFKSPEGTEGVVTFEVNGVKFKVVRRINHPKDGNTLHLVQLDGDKSSEIKKSSMRETQSFLEELLGISFDDFCSLCYYYQKKSSYFGTMSSTYQNYLLMKFLGVLQSQLDKITSDIKITSSEYKTSQNELSGSKSTLTAQFTNDSSRLQTLIAETPSEEEVVRAIEDVSIGVSKDKYLPIIMNVELSTEECITRIKGLLKYPENVSPDNLESTLLDVQESLTKSIEATHSLRQTLTTAKSSIKDLEREFDQCNTSLSSLHKNECPECNRVYDSPPDKSKISSIEEDIRRIAMEIKAVTSEKDETITTLELIDKKRENLHTQVRVLTTYSQILKKIELVIKSIRVDNSIEISNLKDRIRDLGSQVKEIETKDNSISKKLAQCTILSKNVFSSKGVFAKALESVGIALSDYINQLLKNANSSINVTINTVTYNKSGTPSSKLEIVTDFGGGKKLPYECLSGGQSMLVDCLSIIGFYNILSERQSLDEGLLGLIALDEIIQYVDDEYVEIVKSVLEEIQSRALLLISHNPQLGKIFKDVIKVTLNNGISTYDISQLT